MQSTPAYKLRPSGAATWVRCAGSVALAVPENDTDESDNTVREEGTACHWAAHCDAMGTPASAGDTAPNGVEIDDSMLDAVAMYRAALAAWPVKKIYYETPVHCHGIHPQCGGTPDAFAYDPTTRTLYIADLKYGFRIVGVEGNWQMSCYLDGVLNFYNLKLHDVARVVFCVVQPRVWTPDGYVRSWSSAPCDVVPLLQQLQTAAYAALAPTATCVLNDGCSNCSAARRCPTLRNAALTRIDAAFEAIPHDLDFAAAEFELRNLQRSISILKAYETGLYQQVTTGVKSGQRSRWYTMETGTTSLKWNTGSAQAVENIAALMGKNVHKPPALITPTQAGHLLGKSVVALHAQRLQKSPVLVPFDVEKLLSTIRK